MTGSNLCFIKIFAAKDIDWIICDKNRKHKIDYEVIVLIQLRDNDNGRGDREKDEWMGQKYIYR